MLILALIHNAIASPINAFSGGPSSINYAKGLSKELSTLCIGIYNSQKCADMIERYQLKRGMKGIYRNGRDLLISTKSGKSIVLKDSSEDDLDGKWYRYLEFLNSIGYHLIHVQLYEGREYILVSSDTGKYYVIPDVPIISPDMKRMLTVDICDAYCNNELHVLRITQNAIEKEFSLTPKEYWASYDVKWINSKRIKLAIEVHKNNRGTEYVTKEFYIVLTRHGWKTEGY